MRLQAPRRRLAEGRFSLRMLSWWLDTHIYFPPNLWSCSYSLSLLHKILPISQFRSCPKAFQNLVSLKSSSRLQSANLMDLSIGQYCYQPIFYIYIPCLQAMICPFNLLVLDYYWMQTFEKSHQRKFQLNYNTITDSPTRTRYRTRIEGNTSPTIIDSHLFIGDVGIAYLRLGISSNNIACQLEVTFGLNIPSMVLIEVAHFIHKVNRRYHVGRNRDIQCTVLASVTLRFIDG